MTPFREKDTPAACGERYCDRCSLSFQGERCPVCGKKNARAVQPDDLCFLTEQALVWGGMLADVLTQAGIPFLQKNVLGAGVTLRAGSMNERTRFYVFFRHLSEAADLVEALFSAPEEAADEDL